ncbi:MAG: SGNH/GDSL hydrolase family protein [Phycisphaerae bacterium]
MRNYYYVCVLACIFLVSVGNCYSETIPKATSQAVFIDLSSVLSKNRPLVWLFAGDSITQGAVHTHGWRDYTELFKERLYEIERKQDVVINTAISGFNIRRLNSRFDERIGRFRPDVLILMLGTNDAVSGSENLKPFSEQYTEVIKKARQAGITLIVVQTTIPLVPLDIKRVAGSDTSAQKSDMQRLESRLNFLPAYVDATRSVASNEKVPLIDHWAAWPGPISDQLTLMNDAIHPNEYGHRWMAETLFRRCGLWDESSRVCRLVSTTKTK